MPLTLKKSLNGKIYPFTDIDVKMGMAISGFMDLVMMKIM